MSNPERRKNPRYPVNVPARLSSVGGTCSGRVSEVCRDAAFFETTQGIPLETPVEMVLEFPGLPALAIKGRVVREARTSDGKPALAVLFLDETPEFVTQLDFLIHSQDE